MRVASWMVLGGAVLAGPGLLAPVAAAPGAAAALPGALICRARNPAPNPSWAEGLATVPAGSVLRAADAVPTRTDHAALLFRLGLLQGHLMVGRALIEAKQFPLALPHFGHPVRELYGDIRPEIGRRGLTQFDGELVALEALAAGKPFDPALGAQYDKVIRILEGLRATVPSELRDDERFALGVLAQVAGGAAEDYAESIEGGAITKPVEYDDARGYLMYAEAEMKRLEARADGRPSAELKAAGARLGELRAAVAPLVPPRRPIRTVAQFKALVEQFRKATTAAAA